MRNLQEQVKKHSHMKNCSSASNFKSFSQSLEQFFLTVGQNNFGNKIPYFKKFPPAFFNILKEPLLVQKQRIHQQKALDLSFLETESLRGWHYQEDATPARREKHRWAWGKKVLLWQVIVTPS